MNHLPVSKQIYLYRETPEFIKSLNQRFRTRRTLFFRYSKTSTNYSTGYDMVTGQQLYLKYKKVIDYMIIYFCVFFLGNDFMPHFPSLNIRTGGIHVILAAYKNLFRKSNNNLNKWED